MSQSNSLITQRPQEGTHFVLNREHIVFGLSDAATTANAHSALVSCPVAFALLSELLLAVADCCDQVYGLDCAQ